MKKSSLIFFSLLVPYLLAACGPTGGGVTDAGSGSGQDSGQQLDRPDASCGAQTAEIELVEASTPDLLIVLDRSGSMASSVSLFGPSKWSIMKSTLNTITSTYEDTIRFGVTAFPNDDSCGIPAGTEVPIALDNSTAITSWLDTVGPIGQTPAHLALENAASIYQNEPPNAGGRYVLFATDGVPNCEGAGMNAGDATVAAVADLAAAGIPTFVLGFGDLFGLDPGILNDAALAGGVPKAGGPPHYYHANNATDLEMALNDIATGILVPSCSFEIIESPPDPNLVTVTLGDQTVPRDPNHQNGWDYDPDPSFITFYGDYCETIQDGSSGEASFVFGCPGPEIE